MNRKTVIFILFMISAFEAGIAITIPTSAWIAWPAAILVFGLGIAKSTGN